MLYTIDCEFDGFQGALMSCGIVREDGKSLYMLFPTVPTDEWVRKNVSPVLTKCPITPILCPSPLKASQAVFDLISDDKEPVFAADWPVDIQWLCELLVTGPGTMIATPPILQMFIVRADAYPTDLEGAIQHNAWWDAKALMHLMGHKGIAGLLN